MTTGDNGARDVPDTEAPIDGPAPARRRGRPRNPAVDTAILDAAAELLVERGVDGAGIEQIADRAGVAKVTVYRRWTSKTELLARAVEHLREEIPAVDEDGPHAADLPRTIEELLPTWGRMLAEPRFRALTARLVGAGIDHPELLDAFWRHHALPRRQRSAAFLAAAVDAGLLPPETDPEILADMIGGAVLNLLLLRPAPPDADEVTAYLRALLRQAGLVD